VLEDEELHANEEGTPQGGSISVLLSNVYLHYVLDLWFERVVSCFEQSFRPKLKFGGPGKTNMRKGLVIAVGFMALLTVAKAFVVPIG
jgi:hypothetical protein